jgi:DNA-binding response OmpR family regulator
MNEHILVVEDDEHLAAIIRDGLAHHGYVVTVAREGAAALTSVQHHPPALVILDLLLPDLDEGES